MFSFIRPVEDFVRFAELPVGIGAILNEEDDGVLHALLHSHVKRADSLCIQPRDISATLHQGFDDVHANTLDGAVQRGTTCSVQRVDIGALVEENGQNLNLSLEGGHVQRAGRRGGRLLAKATGLVELRRRHGRNGLGLPSAIVALL